MEAFVGSWKLVHDEDYDKYLRATGAVEEVIALASALKPVVTISHEDDIVNINTKSAIGTEKMTFKLGKEFHSEKKDGRYCKVLVELEEKKLVQVEKWDNKEAISVIKIKDGKLIKKITFKDITAVRTFEKA